MIVYGSSISPFVRKVLAFAAEKGVAAQMQPVDFGNPPPEFLAASPFRKIPALRDGDFAIADSSAIVHYLEAKHPVPALIPADAASRGRAVWFDEFADTVIVGAAGKIFFHRIVGPRFMGTPGDESIAAAAERDELPPVLDYLERVVPDAGGFLLGDAVTLADIAVASPFANLRHLGLALDRWPRTRAWVDSMLARPSFAPVIEREARFLAATAM